MGVMNRMLIGILGRKRSGKDTVSDYLVTNHNFKKISFEKRSEFQNYIENPCSSRPLIKKRDFQNNREKRQRVFQFLLVNSVSIRIFVVKIIHP